MPKAVALLSGGLDSTVLAYYLKDSGYKTHFLSFDYGQRHKKELQAAYETAQDLGAQHDLILLGAETNRPRAGDVTPDGWQVSKVTEDSYAFARPLASVLGGSALTDDSVAVPDGHYAEDTMRQTIVPNRNAIMLSIAYGVGVAERAEMVAFAAHSGDHAIYPDCRPAFVNLLEAALRVGNTWPDDTRGVPKIVGPFLNLSKDMIVTEGYRLYVPFEKTWSCYKGGDIHCGRCGTCVERQEAFHLAGVKDPTLYADPDFWRLTVAAQGGT